jgi:hypothetical protein
MFKIERCKIKIGGKFFFLEIPLKRKNVFDVTVERFIKIFELHGIEKIQIPQIVREIKLEDLSNNEKLLQVLTNEVIQKIADLFQVNREWIEGGVKKIYRPQTYHKNPKLFIEKLKSIDYKSTFQPITVFSSESKLDFSSNKSQPIAIVLREKINEIGGKEIFRFYISGDGWNWRENKGRVQLKAMAKIAYENFDIDIPIYQTNSSNIKKIKEGEIVPGYYSMKSKITNISLENFAISPSNFNCIFPPECHYELREKEELSEVNKYIKNHFGAKIFKK